MNNLSRIEQFRQLKKEITKNNGFLLCGLDIGKNYNACSIIDLGRDVLKEPFKFANNQKGFEKLIHHAENTKLRKNKEKTIFGLEPTGIYHKPLASYLIAKGYDVCLISTLAAKKNRIASTARWRKTDPQDAKNVADLMAQGKILFYREDMLDIEQIRIYSKRHLALAKKRRSIKAQFRNNIFAEFFPEIDGFLKDIFSKQSLGILKKYPTAWHMRKVSFECFYRKVLYGKETALKRKQLERIYQLAQDSIGRPGNQAIKDIVRSLLNELTYVDKELTEIDKKLSKTCEGREEYHILQTIPGFGPIFSGLFIGAIGELKNYGYWKPLVRLAGLDLEYSESGNFSSEATISKKGKSLLRYVLCGVTLQVLRYENFAAPYREKLLKKGYSKVNERKLKVKFAVKLLRIAWTLIQKQECFDHEKLRWSSMGQPVYHDRKG